MLKRTSLLTTILTFLSLIVQAQFGIEWIDFSQRYFKVKIVDDGFYRITAAELEAAGFPASTIPPSSIQLFRRGQEVAIRTETTNNRLDYLEFYGQSIDGTGDTPLYDDGDQPHTFYNLFSDTATYFLTYTLGSENGKRMAFSSDLNTLGLTPESYHIQDDLQVYFGSYSTGIQINSTFTLSKYDEGEGWTGTFISKGGSSNHDFVLENRISGANPVGELVLIGGNSLTHNANISSGPNSSDLTVIRNTQFEGYGSILSSFDIPESTIGSGGELTLQVLREGFPGDTDRFSVAYMSVKYRQEVSMQADENKLFTLDNPVSTRAFLRISTTNTDETEVFDINDPINPIRLATAGISGRLEAVVPNVTTGHKILAVTTTEAVESIAEVILVDPELEDKNYLIVTHEGLRSGSDPISDYSSYRESIAGGDFNVGTVEINELFDLFNYGDPSPLAIRNLILYTASIGDPEYVFIIGKGFTQNFNYYRGDQADVNVPTYGLPGSDLMYTLGINTNENLPGIPIGRLNAVTPDDVEAYLNKIVEMEALPYNDLWRKDYLHLSGGFFAGELEAFAGYIENFASVVEEDFVGGRSFNTSKETSESVEFINVADRINQGVGYVTFFGHSSGAATDIEIGRVSNPEFGYLNSQKYPIFLVNGCKAGEIFGTSFTFGEDWMITPNLGAIGFIAHSDFAVSSTLRNWSNLFYDIAFADDNFIGESVGNVMVEVSSRYLSQFGASTSALTQVQQMLLQGDPAYRVFGADNPDYQIENNSIIIESIEEGEVLATQDSFKVSMVVKNFGRTISDSLIVQVDRIFSDGSTETFVDRFLRPLRQDTLVVYLKNDPTNDNTGLNVFNVLLDPQNTVIELDETNNAASTELVIFNGNTSHLFPIDNGVTNEQEVTFIWQSSNSFEENRTYDLEVDTSPNFNSSNRILTSVDGELVLSHTIDFSSLSLPDTSTIYWRTRFTLPEPDETNDWVTTSFSLVNGIQNGWGQYGYNQVNDAFVTGVTFNEAMSQWEFIQSTTPLDIQTFGVDNTTLAYEDVEAQVEGVDFMVTSTPLDPFCRTNTLNVIAFDKESGDPTRPLLFEEIDVFNDMVCGRAPQRIYNFTEDELLVDDMLQVLTDNMRDGDPIVLYSIGELIYSNWTTSLILALNDLGISTTTIAGLTDGQPVIFLGRKGSTPGTAVEVVNNGSALPAREQSISLSDNVNGSFTSGSIRTKRIGPANDWEAYTFNIDEEVNDIYAINVFGVDGSGNATELSEFGRAREETIDIAAIDETQYPQLELEFVFNDEVDLTPPQLNFWQVSYSSPPEGILISSNDITTFQEGQEIQRELMFYNFSDQNFSDSLNVDLILINQSSGSFLESTMRIGPPVAGDTTLFTIEFPSIGFSGSNTLVATVSANENELYSFNNRITLANLIEIESDETNPVLDVTFDGNHILDGDIVSPSPNISIRMRDENLFLPKQDTSGVNVSLRMPGEGSTYVRVNFSDPTLSFTPASESQDFEVTYLPGPLDDGIYGLRIQAEDESGNDAGLEPYEITFEVINESSVTHFYPYPNPFSTSCRFVFTLTGSELPDQIKIQILTVSGRVVREITQDEIGPIHIGSNITEYAWDGRDEYGDQLANGVYFYRVLLNANGQRIDHRATTADRAFKNGFGKLYILR